jgi:hypothetical protein
MRKTSYQFYKNDEKMAKSGFLETKKRAIRQKKYQNDGYSKFLGHVSPTFDESSDPLVHKKHLGQLL